MKVLCVIRVYSYVCMCICIRINVNAGNWHCMSSSTLCLIFCDRLCSFLCWLDFVTSVLQKPASLLPALSHVLGLRLHTAWLLHRHQESKLRRTSVHSKDFTKSTGKPKVACFVLFLIVFYKVLLYQVSCCHCCYMCAYVYMQVWAWVYVC